MAAGATYEPVANYTVSSAQSSYTFSSISQSYTDLVLVISGQASTSDAIFLQVGNGSVDTGSNYSRTFARGTGSAATSGRATAATGMFVLDASTSTQFNLVNSFQNYSNATTYKTILTRANNTSGATWALVNLWRSTSAINTIKIYMGSANFAVGTQFTIYGIAAA